MLQNKTLSTLAPCRIRNVQHQTLRCFTAVSSSSSDYSPMPKPPPQLPQGNAGILSGISENFSFHASPESFIASRVLAYQQANPDVLKTRAIVRAKILNRNVAVVSSYDQVREILTTGEHDAAQRNEPHFAAYPAYEELMEAFFPPPNLLLADGEPHAALRKKWDARVKPLPEKLKPVVQASTQEHFKPIMSTQVDLYDSMKALSWRLLFGVFLDLRPEEEKFKTLEGLHEDLLRGQFSLFPVDVNVGFWRSPRSKGIEARKKLQGMLLAHTKESHSRCPFQIGAGEDEEIADHQLMFTSSLAAKGLASLLMACLMNLFMYKDHNSGKRLIGHISQDETGAESRKLLECMLLETERLSPPIVGVMRRCQEAYTMKTADERPDTILPEGWDVWLYLVGAGRDRSKYGATMNSFDCWRYFDSNLAAPMAFGAGPKSCLGAEVIRSIVVAVLETCIAMRLQIQGGTVPPGVRGWLGWDGDVSPEQWSVDMKQLPTQRPAKPINVSITQSIDET